MNRNKKIVEASRLVKEQYLKDLLSKLADGERISKHEFDAISRLEEEFNPQSSDKETTWFLLDVAIVSDFFGVSKRTVQNWVKLHGCPKEKHGRYDLRAVFAWWREFIGAGTDSPETEDAKQMYWLAKAERERLRADNERSELIPKKVVSTLWASRVSEVTSSLTSLANRLPPRLEGKDQIAMRQIINDEVNLIRAQYSRKGKHCGN